MRTRRAGDETPRKLVVRARSFGSRPARFAETLCPKAEECEEDAASGVDVAELRRRNGDVEAADESVRRRRKRAKVPWTILARMEEEKRAMVRVLEMSWRLNGEEHLLLLDWGGED